MLYYFIYFLLHIKISYVILYLTVSAAMTNGADIVGLPQQMMMQTPYQQMPADNRPVSRKT